ncbi:saccharopine dehydrogenase NADP-binding domain-containing protein [Salinirubellus salinus]|uniref:Saccharopine dehydrogenase NADP-binding domain-containing protein n=1 Tax=Salinirubellus salinus TaxID=1364945 RepID=A0A9E7UCX0_9EURY|nr:saccharopine dehydrogenase NADP-binding domain-containing protein [Salinirubellus salinus]UWM56359.1 saccharopine dehydrogenase NADP-binding domain-containing protein [Salinirubellus salinus]
MLCIYGAYGYTGELVAETAVEAGLDPVLAGRNGARLADVAAANDCEYRAFPVEETGANLDGVDTLLNCAGPFVDTYEPVVDACLEHGVDYLDITGEIAVFEGIAARDGVAADADATLLPGVGFDVVPTDCTARHLADRLPDATHLELAFAGLSSVSRGTALSALESLGQGGAVRRDGRLLHRPVAHATRRVPFADRERTVTAIPWGDLATAPWTTGVPNVTTYAAIPQVARLGMRGSRFLPSAGLRLAKPLLQTLVERTVEGPSERRRERGRAEVWGEARDERTGESVQTRLTTPEPYALTADAAVAAAERVLGGDADPGFQTPGGAFGAAFVTDLPGVSGFDDL